MDIFIVRCCNLESKREVQILGNNFFLALNILYIDRKFSCNYL